jgi:hypothetical protein
MKTLAKEFGSAVLRQNPPGTFTLDNALSTNGWEQPYPGQGLIINKNYIDLAGMAINDKTLFFQGATIQEPLNPLVFNQAAGDSLIMVDVMSQIPLTNDEYSLLLTKGNLKDGSGFKSLTFDQTIYLRIRSFVVDLDTAAWGSMVLVSDNQMGSLDPTASDRVYCARIVSMGSPTTSDRIDIPGVRYILRATAKEEPEYEYLMRLKRSYELQNEPDRD